MKLKISLLLLSLNVFAQQIPESEIGFNLYRKSFNIGIGYNVGTNAGQFNNYFQDQNGNNVHANFGTYGNGIDLKLKYSYKIHPNMAFGVDFGFFSGINKEISNQYYNDSTGLITKQRTFYKANNLNLAPNVIFEVPTNKNNAIYCKIGYLFGSGKITSKIRVDDYYANGNKSNGDFKIETSGGLVHGSQFAIGYRLKIGTGVSFYVELDANTLKQKIKEDNMVEATSNGTNVLSRIYPYYSKTIYSDDVQLSNSNSKPDLSKPRESLSYNALYNSIGFQMGLCFHLK